MSTSRLGEAERALLVLWRRFRRDRTDARHDELDAVQRALLDAWRRCAGSPTARPPWAEALRYRLHEEESTAVATTGLFGRSGYLADSPSRVLGMLLGGAVAEARVRGHVGERTTAVLLVLESLVRAHTRLRVTGTEEPVRGALGGLQRWLHTRGVAWQDCVDDHEHSPEAPDGWLAELLPHATTSDDPAMLTALARVAAGQPLGTSRQPVNRASSATAVPLGALGALWSNSEAAVFDLSTGLAMLSHGDERGHVPAGILGVTVSGLLHGRSLPNSVHAALECGTGQETGSEPTRDAVRFDDHRPVGRLPTRRNLEAMTDGRTGAGALAIAVRTALACPDDFDAAVGVAADHHGDTVTSAVVCGQLLGALHGPTVVPAVRRDALAIGSVLERVSADAAREFGPRPDESAEWLRRYPVPDAPRPAAAAPPCEPAHWQPRFAGGVLGCAVGEALGTPITPETWDEIHRRYGAHGLVDYVPAGHPAGRLGSDSQLLLFSLEGMIRAGIHRRSTGNDDPTRHVQHAHQRWLHTQHLSWPRAAGEFLSQAPEPDGWLVGQRALFQTRTPGRTMMRTLIAFAKGQQGMGTPEEPVSDSRGSAALVRAVPAALWSNEPAEVFRVARNTAALTHGSPAAYLSAGALAVMISRLMHEESLPVAADAALDQLSHHPDRDVTRAIEAAKGLAVHGPVDPDDLEHRLGAGWTAPEALSIGLYAALACDGDFDAGLSTAVNHSGNSATTAAVGGSLLGATLGSDGVPARWITDLELAETIERLASDAALEFGPRPPTGQDWPTRYPPT